MSWSFEQIPGTMNWEFILKASHDFEDSYLVLDFPGGAELLLNNELVISLRSVNSSNGGYKQIIAIRKDSNKIEYLSEKNPEAPIRIVEGMFRLPRVAHNRLVAFLDSIPPSEGNILPGAGRSYDQGVSNRNHSRMVTRGLPSNVGNLISSYTAPAEGGRRRKTRRNRK